MSLIIDMMESCCFKDKTTSDDPYGSTVRTGWHDGASFMAAVIKNNTTEAIVAEKQGITEIFTVVFEKGLALDYHDVFKRLSDGQIFRVTSNVKDSEAPAASTIQLAKVTAEKWVIPDA